MQRKVKVEGEVEREEGRTPTRTDVQFDAFYAAYPIRKAKGSAIKAWAKLTTAERDLCLPAITAQVKASHFRGSDGKDYVPHPATWINARRWEDEVTAPATPVRKPGEIDMRNVKPWLIP